MRLLRIVGSLFAAAATVSICGCGLLPSTSGQKQVAAQTLDAQAQELKAQFNRDRGKVRLLFIMDPKCAICLRGLADLDRDLLSKSSDNIAVYIVHMPVVGGTLERIPGAAGLVQSAKPRHYWDPEAVVGDRFTDVLSLRTKGEPALAWDVWLAYGPEAEWAETPPKPRVAMHQLSPIDPNPNITYLDSKEFARLVHDLLPKDARSAEG